MAIESPPMCDIVATNEIDLATAKLYEQIRSSPRHRRLISRIEASDAPFLMGPTPRIVVMPGAFHVEYPHTGGDGQRVFELAEELGWPVERVNVPSLAPMAHNAALLAECLLRYRGQAIILVSLSKGSSDVRMALARADAPAIFQDVRAWVSLSGMINGTP